MKGQKFVDFATYFHGILCDKRGMECSYEVSSRLPLGKDIAFIVLLVLLIYM